MHGGRGDARCALFVGAHGRWVKTCTYGEERAILPRKNHLSMFTCYSTCEKVLQNLWQNRIRQNVTSFCLRYLLLLMSFTSTGCRSILTLKEEGKKELEQNSRRKTAIITVVVSRFTVPHLRGKILMRLLYSGPSSPQIGACGISYVSPASSSPTSFEFKVTVSRP